MMENYLFIVEGNHDIAYLNKLLILLEYKVVKKNDELNEIMKRFVPKSFPFTGEKLEIFNIVPYYFKKSHKQIAIINANGETNILAKLDEKLSEIKLEEAVKINHVIIFADGDLHNSDEKIRSILDVDFDVLEFDFLSKDELASDNPQIRLMGEYSIPLKYYIFPNNKDSGRLETILLKSIKITNDELLTETKNFLEKIDSKYKVDWNEGNSNREKTIVGIVGNVLIPGSSSTTSISNKDVSWISKHTIDKVSELENVFNFLKSHVG